eukprot:5160648-Alexandrium_andersonii.AAC.1
MSASLVGSEMCIRDRPGVGPCGPALPAGMCTALAFWPGACVAVALPAPPVSYTHLTLPTICSV